MRTIKASLKVNKNGRLYCALHKTYKIITQPTTDCTICWTIYEKSCEQIVLDILNDALVKGNKKHNESH
jgi:hypothetical protein